MTAVLHILCDKDPEIADLSLAKIVQFLGLEHRFISINDVEDGLSSFHDREIRKRLCLASSYATLVKVLKEKRLSSLEVALQQQRSTVLVYCVSPMISESDALSKITGNMIKGVSSFEHDSYQYKINEGITPIAKEFSGLSFGPINKKYDFKFELSEVQSGAEKIISVNSEPIQ